MTEAEEIYHRFVNYECNAVSDGLKESILKAINEALTQGSAFLLTKRELEKLANEIKWFCERTEHVNFIAPSSNVL
ncbi:MAG: hypothetical protein GY679_00215 [Mycoplasma sp.]|nr:hypothetical protein [Mycoplasma sp.]